MLIKMLLTHRAGIQGNPSPMAQLLCQGQLSMEQGSRGGGQWLGSGSALQACPGWAKPRSQLQGLHEDHQHGVTSPDTSFSEHSILCTLDTREAQPVPPPRYL